MEDFCAMSEKNMEIRKIVVFSSENGYRYFRIIIDLWAQPFQLSGVVFLGSNVPSFPVMSLVKNTP